MSSFARVELPHAGRLVNHGPRVDNTDLQTIHHLGGGNLVRAGGTLQARPL